MAKKKLSPLGKILKKMVLLAQAKFATNAALAVIANRVTQLEESDGPFALGVDFETGMLQQTGTANGTFGVDYESGYLTFTPASVEEET